MEFINVSFCKLRLPAKVIRLKQEVTKAEVTPDSLNRMLRPSIFFSVRCPAVLRLKRREEHTDRNQHHHCWNAQVTIAHGLKSSITSIGLAPESQLAPELLRHQDHEAYWGLH